MTVKEDNVRHVDEVGVDIVDCITLATSEQRRVPHGKGESVRNAAIRTDECTQTARTASVTFMRPGHSVVVNVNIR